MLLEMNISSSHVQNTFFPWTLHTTIWHGASNFPRPRVVQSITYNITPSTQGHFKQLCGSGDVVCELTEPPAVEGNLTPPVQLPYHSVQRKKVFWTWLEEMFISSNMRGDISLLNVYCGAAMMEVCLCSKKSAIRWVFGLQTPFE